MPDLCDHAADEQILWQWTPADGVAALASACSGLHLADADEHALVKLPVQVTSVALKVFTPEPLNLRLT
jgi:hypothetical protein